jgi:hypothetical protein
MFSSNTSQVSSAANYIEDVFSTYLYTGNGSTQTITNGIDLSTYGGLVWIKSRSSVNSNFFTDTSRGATAQLQCPGTAAQSTNANGLTAFSSSGFSIGSGTGYNTSSDTQVSWAFRKQSKFFDVVTYTGTGSAQNIAHNLGSAPGCIIVKRTSGVSNWSVYHRSLGNTDVIYLDSTSATSASSTTWNNTTPTSTQFTVGTSTAVNGSGSTYVAYLFAHNAGGFGLTGSDNVISCGSYSGNSSNPPFINLGWEPQFVMVKLASYAFASGGWHIFDNMRGMGVQSPWQNLSPNLSDAESGYGAGVIPTATGFQLYGNDYEVNTNDGGSATYIYIAIRRGPMKTPTSGTSVFTPVTYTGNSNNPRLISTGPNVVDFVIARDQLSSVRNIVGYDRLRGSGIALRTNLTNAEVNPGSPGYDVMFDANGGYLVGNPWSAYLNYTGYSEIGWAFGRAPSFMDVVCYTGDGVSGRNISHNLTVAPELVIIKARNRVDDWVVRSSAFPTNGVNGIAYLNDSAGETNAGYSYVPTATTFQVDNNNNQNGSTYTYVAYLFASCPGVSKVGSYTGTGSTQTISCGFAARFVLIKRTDTSGYGWLVWDTARGMVSGTDPYLVLNLTNAEVNTNYVYTNASGFQIVTSVNGINANGGTYIYLAIA